MKFKPVSKIIFSYTNKQNHLICHHIIDDLHLFNEYEIQFKSDSNESLSYININFFTNDNKLQNISLNINKSYKFQNRNIKKLEIDIILKDKINFYLNILEKPIIFEENSYEVSPLVKNFVNKIDDSSRPQRKSSSAVPVNVACILDEFTYECFSYECNLLQLKSTTWQNQLEEFSPDILLVESAWYGVCKTWIKKIACDEKLDSTLSNIVDYCKNKNIPTVFFNKEGLVNLHYFEKSSSIFDYVFVSDENIIPYQINLCNHDRVYPLSFAAQPKIHNSINKNKYKLGSIAFAGGWYGDIHDLRVNDFEYILKPALNYGVHIYDRNFHQRSMLEFINMYWPEDYIDNIVGKLEYKYMVEAYKNYTLFLNVNSVQDSSYMISRRVYEILACKTLVLSSYSKCIDDNFKDYVLISRNKEDTLNYLGKLMTNTSYYEKQVKKSQRYILENHTYKHRLLEILNIVNIKYKKSLPPNIGLICIIEDVSHIENVSSIISNQNYKPDYTYLIINKKINIESYKNLFTLENLFYNFYDNESSINHIFSHIYNLNHHISHYCLFYSKNYYAPNYIRDYINIFSYYDGQIIGKSHVYQIKDGNLTLSTCSNKDCYADKVYKDTLFFTKECIISLPLYKDNISCEYICNSNFILYSDDEYNFMRNIVNNDCDDKNKYIQFISI